MSFVQGVFGGNSPAVQPPVVNRSSTNTLCDKILKIALSILASLVSFFFLPAEAAMVVTGIVALLSAAIFLGQDGPQVTPPPPPAGLWRTVSNLFYTPPHEPVNPTVIHNVTVVPPPVVTPMPTARPATSYCCPSATQTTRQRRGAREEVDRPSTTPSGGFFGAFSPPPKPLATNVNVSPRLPRTVVKEREKVNTSN